MFGFLKKPRIVVKTKTEYVYVDPTKRLTDKIALVTGASGSIGSAISYRLALEGATVILAGRSADKLNALAQQLKHDNLMADVIIMDVTDETSVSCAMRKVAEKYGRIDILINNAGFIARSAKKMLHDQDIQHIDELLSTNLRGPLLTSREVIPYMQKSDFGRIIHVSSIVGLQGKACHAEYAAAKAGLFGLMKSQAIEVGCYGITVNCVSPGLVPRKDASEEKLAKFQETNCLNRICSPEDIAHTCAFLASNEACFITGQNIVVDGGRSLGLRGD